MVPVVQLNMDVIAEILSRLRVKDLIRFKSVCKSWLQLISSQEFIQLHLSRSRFRAIPFQNRYFDIDCCHLPNSNGDPFNNNIFMGSSSDGLVCLFNKMHALIHIWNPAIRSSACIPLLTHLPVRGFWFGIQDNEYKIVLISDTEIHVINPYINSSYNWQSTETKLKNVYCFSQEIGTLSNGNVHCAVFRFHISVGSPRLVCKILSYDLHQENSWEIGLPVEMHCVGLGEIGGCLSALLENSSMEFELWRMKDYGLEESWVKLIVLEAGSAILLRSMTRPEEDVVLDDPEMIKSPLYWKEVYVESLVSPLTERMRSRRIHKTPCQITQITSGYH